jgi:hypothetical protein
VSREWTK